MDKAINEGKDTWFVSPTYNNVATHWRNIKDLVGERATYKNEQQRYLEFQNGDRKGSISCKSGDRPDNLLGVGLDYVVIDEAAYQQSDLWHRVLRPALSDRVGGALIISTPNGTANWFYWAYTKGQDPLEQEWASWRFRTIDNPYIRPEEIDQAKSDLPELRFKQEYMAEFLSDAGGVFRGLEAACVGTGIKEPLESHTYVAGVDWGRHNDFTVISIWDRYTGEQAEIIRFTDIGYDVQKARLIEAHNKWNFSTIQAEANAAGAPLIEALQAEKLPVKPIYTTNVSKTAMVESLALRIERRDIHPLAPTHSPSAEIQFAELSAYQLQHTAGGRITYRAPHGWHDDTVSAAFIANTAIRAGRRSTGLNSSRNIFYHGFEDNY